MMQSPPTGRAWVMIWLNGRLFSLITPMSPQQTTWLVRYLFNQIGRQFVRARERRPPYSLAFLSSRTWLCDGPGRVARQAADRRYPVLFELLGRLPHERRRRARAEARGMVRDLDDAKDMLRRLCLSTDPESAGPAHLAAAEVARLTQAIDDLTLRLIDEFSPHPPPPDVVTPIIDRILIDLRAVIRRCRPEKTGPPPPEDDERRTGYSPHAAQSQTQARNPGRVFTENLSLRNRPYLPARSPAPACRRVLRDFKTYRRLTSQARAPPRKQRTAGCDPGRRHCISMD
jgi:hypothetical protein